jgi:hypothetical protein
MALNRRADRSDSLNCRLCLFFKLLKLDGTPLSRDLACEESIPRDYNTSALIDLTKVFHRDDQRHF